MTDEEDGRQSDQGSLECRRTRCILICTAELKEAERFGALTSRWDSLNPLPRWQHRRDGCQRSLHRQG